MLIELVNRLEQIGVSEVLLPFFVVFIFVFALLEKAKIFSNKKVNVVAGICIAGISIIPHVISAKPDIVPTINNALPIVALTLVFFFAMRLLMSTMNVKIDNSTFKTLIALIVIIEIIIPDFVIISLIFQNLNLELPPFLSFLTSQIFLTGAIVFASISLFVYYVSKNSK